MSLAIEAVAIHEAAHCVAGVNKGLRMNKSGVTIVPTKRFTGKAHISTKGYSSRNPGVRKAVNEAGIVHGFAGPMAQHKVSGQASIDGDVRGINLDLFRFLLDEDSESRIVAQYASYGFNAFIGDVKEPHPNWRKETYEIHTIVQTLCVTPDSVTALSKFLPDVAVRLAVSDHFRILGTLADEAHQLLDRHWSTVQELAERLLQLRAMSGPEVEAFVVDHLGYFPQRIAA